MPIEYHVSSYTGPADTISTLLESLSKEVTHNIRVGATLVGGISIVKSRSTIIVSQAMTYIRGETDNLLH